MASNHPISDFQELLTGIVPSEVVSKGIDAFNDEVHEAFMAFADYVLSSVNLEFDDEFERDMFIMPEACNAPVSSVFIAVNETQELLDELGVRDLQGEELEPPQEHEEVEPTRWIDGMMSPAMLIHSLDRFNIDTLPSDSKSEVLRAAISTCREYAAIMMSFVERVADICNNGKGTLELIPYFFKDVNKTEQQLRHICGILKDKRYIEPATNEDDFVYFFTGKGTVPNQRLRWLKKNTVLFTIFISEMTSDNRRWKTASSVFETWSRKAKDYSPPDEGVLGSTYNRAPEQEVYPSHVAEINALLN